jgi:hypothetical protein
MLQRIKIKLKSNLFVYSLYTATKMRLFNSKYNIVNSNTDMCVEAYPSSANTFLQYLLEELNDQLILAHHSHSTPNMKKAIIKNKPLIVIIRHPRDAIASRLARFPHINKGFAIYEYKEFYSYVYRNHKKTFIITFKDITENPYSVLRRLDELYNFNLNIQDLRQAIENVKERIKDDEKDVSKLALPSDERDKLKKSIKNTIIEHKGYNKCEKTYNNIIDLINTKQKIK